MELELQTEEKEGEESVDIYRRGQADLTRLEKRIENMEKIIEGRLETEEANFNGTIVVIDNAIAKHTRDIYNHAQECTDQADRN
jgi:hypothetical protein